MPGGVYMWVGWVPGGGFQGYSGSPGAHSGGEFALVGVRGETPGSVGGWGTTSTLISSRGSHAGAVQTLIFF